MVIKRFTFGKDESEWNEFLNTSKNQTFLFNRGFMDYHKDRFNDYSLMIYNEKNHLICCFPATLVDAETISSHAGLSYGGFIIKNDLKLPVVLDVIAYILQYFHQKGVKRIILKAFPRMYNRSATDEVEYALFLLDAKLIRKDSAMVIDNLNRQSIAGNIRREANKAAKNGYVVESSADFNKFWEELLIPNLKSRFNVNPVHSTSEIILLNKMFPNNIDLYICKNSEGEIEAGTVFFQTDNVYHCQYIASNDIGRGSGALNYLFYNLITEQLTDKRFFDFGIVNENNGRYINQGMLAWKERMGGRTVAHDFYEVETSGYEKLFSVVSK